MVNMFIEFKNDRIENSTVSIDVTDIRAYVDTSDTTVDIYTASGNIFSVAESKRSVKTKINNTRKRIAKGAQVDSDSELETT